MPVTLLLVEGELDSALIVAVRGGAAPAIEIGGSKGSLAPKARDARRKNIVACYLRDRDFDHEPPADLSQPTVDEVHDGRALGWRWSRHEIESYLLEPSIVSLATGWEASAYVGSLRERAREIAYYTASRWVLSLHRNRMDRERLFRARPDWDNEMKVPEDLSLGASQKFLLETLSSWYARIARPADDDLCTEHAARAARLLALESPADILLWHSGKDLFGALAPQIHAQFRIDPKTFSRRLRDWIRDHPAIAMEHLPEWAALFRCIAAEP